jgi:UrcA family protein
MTRWSEAQINLITQPETSMNTRFREILVTLSAATALICLLPAANASTASPAEVHKETVKFQDLNLQTPAGAETLYKRIHAAAQHVCDTHGDRSMSAASHERECIAQAEARAVTQVNAPALSAYYSKKLGRPVASELARAQ